MSDENTQNHSDYSCGAALPDELERRLISHLSVQTGPGKGNFRAVSLAGVAVAAAFLKVSKRQAMITLLNAGIWPLRFARNRGVSSADDQANLLSSTVAVIGCGGLGGYVATLLARQGVGALTLCDYDCFEESNLNRQFGANESTLGKNKAVVIGNAIKDMASHVELRIVTEAATPESLPSILHGSNIVVDCLDSLPLRLQVEAAAHTLKLPFVHGSVSGGEGFVMVSRPGSPNLHDIFDEEIPASGSEAIQGVPTLTPVGVAMIEVRLAVREILGFNGKDVILRHLDLEAMCIESMKL